MRLAVCAAVPALVLLAACGKDKNEAGDSGGADAQLPDEICHSGVDFGLEGAFAEETEAWGLTGITATRFSTADLDGDGYPDLIASEGDAFARDDFDAGTRYHWLLMNRDDGDGGRTFVDETEASGLFQIRGEDASAGGRPGQINVFGDVDNDGDLDVFSGHFNNEASDDGDLGDRSELLLNDGTGSFTLAEPSDFHVDDGYATSGASFHDFDGDGVIDLWMTGWYESYGGLHGEQDHLLRGNGDGTFSEVTEDAGLEMRRGSNNSAWIEGTARRPAFGATACDLDGDALPDLLASNYGRAWNQQWMNQGDGAFEDVSQESGFSDDGRDDYSDNQFYRCYCEVYGCTPDPGAAALGDCASYAAYWSSGWDDQPHRLNGNTFSTACADVDNDGDMDLMSAEIVHWHIGNSSDPSELLLNDGSGIFERPGNESNGLFRDWDAMGVSSWNEGDLFVGFADLDADGWKDIVLISSDYPDTRMFVYRQVAEGQFEEVAEDAGLDQPWPAGLAIADFDLDGDLDIVTGSSTTRSGTPWSDHQVHLYENELSERNHLRIELVGDDANAAGIGARVEVTTDSLTQVQEVSGGYGHMGIHNDVALTFGAGEDCGPAEVTVTWPGGAVDIYGAVPVNYRVTLTQEGGVSWAE